MLEGFINTSAMLKPGVYALVREGVVVYVGQSKKPLSRVEAHRSLGSRKSAAPGWLPIKGIIFDEVHVLPCRIEDLDRVERAMIDLYKPRFNCKLKAPTPVAAEFNLAAFTKPQSQPIVRRF
jgi:excinuclease UvrABC nuclease subunit